MEKKMKKIHEIKMYSKVGKKKPWLSFDNAVLKILEEGPSKRHEAARRACIKTLVTVAEAKEVSPYIILPPITFVSNHQVIVP